MKQIIITLRENVNGAKWGPGFNIPLLTEADVMDGEFDNTVRLLKTLLIPGVQITTANIVDHITHRFVATPI